MGKDSKKTQNGTMQERLNVVSYYMAQGNIWSKQTGCIST